MDIRAPATPLVGRDAELRLATSLLRDADVRLLTVTGPPGVGKTHLVLVLAQTLLQQFEHGVVVIPLNDLDDPTAVGPAIASALDVPACDLRHALRTREVLLVLDSFEGVSEAALELEDLLASCVRAKVLGTSRGALHLRGEHELPLQPLDEQDAVALFATRAQAIQPDFQLTRDDAATIAGICRRLDGLPLGIELAVERLRVLAPRALLGRLRRPLQLLTSEKLGIERRHQTMRDAIAWSYDLLDPGHQRNFRSLAAFAGGCTLEAAEAVCAANDGAPVLDSVQVLVDRQLVRVEAATGRLQMLRLVQDFGLEQLQVTGETTHVSRSIALFMLALAEAAVSEPGIANRLRWLERLEREHDNLVQALDWARATRETWIELRLSAAMAPFGGAIVCHGRGCRHDEPDLDQVRACAG
jgi:predicted ATPase